MSARVEDGVWPLLRLFKNPAYARRWVKEDNSLENDHFERITNGILQAEEYFRAALHTSLATSPVLLYYGMLHLADVVIAANGENQPQHHGLKRVREKSSDPLNHLKCRVESYGVFASFNRLVGCDVTSVRNPLGKEGVVFSTNAAVAEQYPQREAIVGNTVHLRDLIGAIPDLNEHCAYTKDIICWTLPLHDIQIQHTHGELTLSLALRRDLKHFVQEELTARLGMEELTEGVDLVAFRLVGGADGINLPHLRATLKGRPHLLAGGTMWRISEAATMLLLMFILGDLARYWSNLWIKFISQGSEERELVNEFINVATTKFPSKFPYLMLTQLRGQLLLFMS